MNALGLFEGIGGLSLGLEAQGCKLVAYSEVDPYACQVLAARFPNAVNLGDITTIDWEEVAREHSIDIIIGGFPCQDISTQGRGAGMGDDTRSGLWRHFADAIRVLRPRGVIVENVAALLARGIDRVLGDLAACGFDAEWDCVPSSALGGPSQRDRVFIVAYPSGVGQPRPWQRPEPCDPAASPYREADHVVHAVRRDALPFVCRRHPRVPARLAGPRLKAIGNAVDPQVAAHVAGILLDRMEAG